MTLQPEQEWQRLYTEALLETDPHNLAGLVALAEKAMLLRVAELCTVSDRQDEWQAVEDAIVGLSMLKRELHKSKVRVKTARVPVAVSIRFVVS
jgi:hypothetical protein